MYDDKTVKLSKDANFLFLYMNIFNVCICVFIATVADVP